MRIVEPVLSLAAKVGTKALELLWMRMRMRMWMQVLKLLTSLMLFLPRLSRTTMSMGSRLMKAVSEPCGATAVAVVAVQRGDAVHSCVAGCVIALASSHDGRLGFRLEGSHRHRGLCDYHHRLC